jgi:hypothetical protein
LFHHRHEHRRPTVLPGGPALLKDFAQVVDSPIRVEWQLRSANMEGRKSAFGVEKRGGPAGT